MLTDCLDHLSRLEQPADEIIVVLQGERGADTAQYVRGTFPHVTVRIVSWCGASLARNYGARETDADLLLFVDDDCTVDRAWLNAYREVFACDPRIAAAAGRVLPRGTMRPGMIALAVKLRSRGGVYTGARDPFDPLNSGGNLAVRKRVFDELRGFDPELGPGTAQQSSEDADLVYRLLVGGYRVAYVPGAIVGHTQWRTTAQARKVVFGYGIGMGAFLVKHIRLGDRYAVRLAAWLLWRHGVRPLAGGMLSARRERWQRGITYLEAIPRGIVRGLHIPLDPGKRLYVGQTGQRPH